MFSHEITITDSMVSNAYGHIHHAESVKFLETARNAYLVSCGLPHESLHKEDVFIVVTRIDVRYVREVRVGKYYSNVKRLYVEGESIVAIQELRREDGELCLRAKVRLACMSGTTRKGIPLPEKLQMILSTNNI